LIPLPKENECFTQYKKYITDAIVCGLPCTSQRHQSQQTAGTVDRKQQDGENEKRLVTLKDGLGSGAWQRWAKGKSADRACT
jgi:hypothetical protein